MGEIIVLGVPVAIIIMALTGICRSFVKDSRWYPIIAIGWGVIIAVMVMAAPFTLHSVLTAIVYGVVLGLSAAGLFDTGKGGIKIIKEKVKEKKEINETNENE